jgi:hypothetical protein
MFPKRKPPKPVPLMTQLIGLHPGTSHKAYSGCEIVLKMSNLLPKKLWHVGRAENIERVKVDEKRAEIIGKRASDEADRDARLSRLELLRKRSKPEVVVKSTDESQKPEAKDLRMQPLVDPNEGNMCMSKDLGKQPWYSRDIEAPKKSIRSDELVRLDPIISKQHTVTDRTKKTVDVIQLPCPSLTIDDLRRERLEREAREREKARNLLRRRHFNA